MTAQARHLPDLTTAGRQVHPDALAVAPAGWKTAAQPVPGSQLSGSLEGHGRYVLRIPDDWNGNLVVGGTPGTRTEYAGDLNFSDFVLPRGYAYLAGDKGGTGGGLVAGARLMEASPTYPFGVDFALLQPSVSIVGWTTSLLALTGWAKERIAQARGQAPGRTYLMGISNGGYQVRRALETAPELYDGGVDWEGVHWTADGPNILTYLPVAVRGYRVFADRSASSAQREEARLAMLAAGLPAGSEPLWEIHNRLYWGVTSWLFQRKLDPDFQGDPATYALSKRPEAVFERLRAISTNGAIGRPLLSLHGTLDCLLPPVIHAQPYAEAIGASGRAHLHRLYLVERGNHVENFAALLPEARLELLLPHVQRAFELLVDWVERGREPPPSGTSPSAGGSPDGR